MLTVKLPKLCVSNIQGDELGKKLKNINNFILFKSQNGFCTQAFITSLMKHIYQKDIIFTGKQTFITKATMTKDAYKNHNIMTKEETERMIFDLY